MKKSMRKIGDRTGIGFSAEESGGFVQPNKAK